MSASAVLLFPYYLPASERSNETPEFQRIDLKRAVVTDLFATPIILWTYGDGSGDVLERVKTSHQRVIHGVLHDNF